MDAAPTMQKMQVSGMVLYNPPRAVPLIFPVRYITAPMDMKRSALNRMSLKAWATAPLMARCRADADAAHHETHLVDQAVGKDPPQVIFNDRIEDGKSGHDRPDPDEGLGSGKGPCQGIDRDLGGKGAQEDGSGDGCLRIGIGEPGMKDGPGTIQAKTNKYEITCPVRSIRYTRTQWSLSDSHDRTMPARRHRPPAAWTRRYRYPAPRAAFVLRAQMRKIELTVSISQKTKKEKRSPAKTTPRALPA